MGYDVQKLWCYNMIKLLQFYKKNKNEKTNTKALDR
jgi:hypothetical protein